MASQSVRDVNTSTSTAQEAPAAADRYAYTRKDTIVEPDPAQAEEALQHGNAPRRTSTTTHTSTSSTTTQTSTTHTSTTPSTTTKMQTHTSAKSAKHKAADITASKPVGLKDEFVGGMKKLTGAIVCSQSLKAKGRAQVEKGKQEVAAARAHKENLSPHFAKDGNNGFLGGMESTAMQRMAEQERRHLTGPRTDDAINADFVQQYRQRTQPTDPVMADVSGKAERAAEKAGLASATQATSEQPPRKAHLEKTDPLSESAQNHQERQPLDVWNKNRENTEPVVVPRTEDLPVAGHQEKSPRYVHNAALHPSPNMPRV